MLLDFLKNCNFFIRLYFAVFIFTFPISSPRQKLALRICTGLGAGCALSGCFYFLKPWIIDTFGNYSAATMSAIFVWYLLITLSALAAVGHCFWITHGELIYVATTGYTVQQISYLISRWAEEVFFVHLCAENVYFYLLIQCLPYGLVCAAAVYCLRDKWKEEEIQALGNSHKAESLYLLVLCLFIAISRLLMLVFTASDDVMRIKFSVFLVEMIICLIFLIIQYGILYLNKSDREKNMLIQLLHEKQKQYETSRDNIELINRKTHDLKHHLSALRHMRGEEQKKIVDEIEKAVVIYDSTIHTENEAVDVILTERKFECEKHHITFSSIVNAKALSFMKIVDIYVLLGNALDNAIESAGKIQDYERRVIGLKIDQVANFISIYLTNYYEGEIRLKDDLPVTTKGDQGYHGYGIKSMKYIVDKYHGTLCIDAQKGIFTLEILIPLDQ